MHKHSLDASRWNSADAFDPPQLHQTEDATFEEAVFAVDHVDASPLQAGGAVHLAVVLIEAAIGATHGHERRPALLLADALGAAGFCHHGALSAPPTVGPPAGTVLRVGGSWKCRKDVVGQTRSQ